MVLLFNFPRPEDSMQVHGITNILCIWWRIQGWSISNKTFVQISLWVIIIACVENVLVSLQTSISICVFVMCCLNYLISETWHCLFGQYNTQAWAWWSFHLEFVPFVQIIFKWVLFWIVLESKHSSYCCIHLWYSVYSPSWFGDFFRRWNNLIIGLVLISLTV